METRKYTFDNLRILVALDKPSDFEATRKNVVGALDRLEQYEANGNSCEGLPFKYKSVKTFC